MNCSNSNNKKEGAFNSDKLFFFLVKTSGSNNLQGQLLGLRAQRYFLFQKSKFYSYSRTIGLDPEVPFSWSFNFIVVKFVFIIGLSM